MNIFNLTNGAVFDMWAMVTIITLITLYKIVIK